MTQSNPATSKALKYLLKEPKPHAAALDVLQEISRQLATVRGEL